MPHSDPVARREYQRTWERANYERIKANRTAEQIERKRARDRAYYAANRDRLLAASVARGRENPEAVRLRAKEWRDLNPERAKANAKASKRARKARVRGAAGKLTAKEWQRTLEVFGGYCAFCLGPLQVPTQDHFLPLNRGGCHDSDNVIPCCAACNSIKSDSLISVWVSKLT